MLGGGFVKLYVLLYIFFLTTEKIGIYILTTGMLLSKTPSQKHDKHRANTQQVTIELRVTGELVLPFLMSKLKGQKKGSIRGHFLHGYILKGCMSKVQREKGEEMRGRERGILGVISLQVPQF